MHNLENNDPDCNYPNPAYSDQPSYVAKSGDCVRVGPNLYGRFEISSTTGKDERNDFESWEIPDINKNIDMTVSESTPEAQLDRKDVAGSCMIESFSVYADPDCS